MPLVARDYKYVFSSTPLPAKTHVRKLFPKPNPVGLNNLSKKTAGVARRDNTLDLRASETTQAEAVTSKSYQSAQSHIGSPPASFYTPTRKKYFTLVDVPASNTLSFRNARSKVAEPLQNSSKNAKANHKRHQYHSSVKITHDVIETSSSVSDTAENIDTLEHKSRSKPQASYDSYDDFIADFSRTCASAKIVNTFETPGYAFWNSNRPKEARSSLKESSHLETTSRSSAKKKFAICTEAVNKKTCRSFRDQITMGEKSYQKEKATQSALQSPKVLSKPACRNSTKNKSLQIPLASRVEPSYESESEACLVKPAETSFENLSITSVLYFSDSDDEVVVRPSRHKLVNSPIVPNPSLLVSKLSREGNNLKSKAQMLRKSVKEGLSSSSSLAGGIERVLNDTESLSSVPKALSEKKRLTPAEKDSSEEHIVHAACTNANNTTLKKHKFRLEPERFSPLTKSIEHSKKSVPNTAKKATRASHRKEPPAEASQPSALAAGQSSKSYKAANDEKSSFASQSLDAEPSRRVTRQMIAKSSCPRSKTPLEDINVLKESPFQSRSLRRATSLETKGSQLTPPGLNNESRVQKDTPALSNTEKRCLSLRNRVVLLTPPESRENSLSRSSNSNSADMLDGSSTCSVSSGGRSHNDVVAKDGAIWAFKLPEPVKRRKRKAASIGNSVRSEESVSRIETPGKPVPKKPRVVERSDGVISSAVTRAKVRTEENLNVTSPEYSLRSRSLVSSTRVLKYDLRTERSLSTSPTSECRSRNSDETELESERCLPEMTAKKRSSFQNNRSIEIRDQLMRKPLLDEKLVLKRAVVILDTLLVDQWQREQATKSVTSRGVESQEKPKQAKRTTRSGKNKETSGTQNTVKDVTPHVCEELSNSRKSTTAKKAQVAPKLDKKRSRTSKSQEKVAPPTFEGPPRTARQRQQIMRYLTQKEEEIKMPRTSTIYGRMEEWADVIQSKLDTSGTSSLRTPTTPCSSFVGTPSASRYSESEDERRQETPVVVRNTVAEVTKLKNVQKIHKVVKEREKQARNVEKTKKRKVKLGAKGVGRTEEKKGMRDNQEKGNSAAEESEGGYATDDDEELAAADQIRNFSPPKVAKKLFHRPEPKPTSLPPFKENDRSVGNLQDMQQVVERTLKTAKTKRRKFKYNLSYNGCPLEVTAFAVVEDEEDEKEFSDSESDA